MSGFCSRGIFLLMENKNAAFSDVGLKTNWAICLQRQMGDSEYDAIRQFTFTVYRLERSRWRGGRCACADRAVMSSL
jgi:hypothetical protein